MHNEFDPTDYHLKPIGAFRPRATREIESSRIGVGFETLDRYHFDPERTYPHLAELGAKWARVQTGWNRCEREPGVYEFSWLDEVVDSLLEIGVRPFFNLGFGNLLYTPDAPHDSARGYVAFYYGDEAARAWRAYVSAIAEHFRDRVTFWEIWNEPNAVGFWRPEDPRPADYVRLLAETVPEIRRAVPDATVIGGVFSTVRPAPTAAFAEACFEAGMAEWIDVLCWHPYRSVPEHGYRNEVAGLRRLIARYAPGTGLWQGECGCQSARGGLAEFMDMDHLTETIQAKWVLRRIITDLGLDLGYTQYFHTVDLFDYIMHDGPSGKNQYMGLLRGEDYSPKPSFRALQVLCSLLDGKARQADLVLFPRTVREIDYTTRFEIAAVEEATFVRNGRPVYAYWYPSHFDEPIPPQPILIDAWHGAAASLERPVLIDPLTRQVYDLSGTRIGAQSGGDVAEPTGKRDGASFRLPLTDYPLLVTDREAIEGMIG